MMPRSTSGIIIFLICSVCGIFACRFFKLTHPEYLFALAFIQGTWLGVWCQDLHQFAGSHGVPRFASRITKFYLMVLLATGLFIAAIALVNHDLFSIVGLLMAIVVIASVLTLLTRNLLLVLVVVFAVILGMNKIPDVGREGIANLLNSIYLYPVSVLALLPGLAILHSLLIKPVNIERRSLRQDYGNNIENKRWHSGGLYGVSWFSHLRAASGGILFFLVFFHFYEPPLQMFSIVWSIWILSFPVQNIGRSMSVAPRAWLSGAIHSRAELSSALLIRFLSIAGIYTLAGLALSPLASLLSIDLPENTGSVVVAAFVGSALSLGLISSYSSNLEEKTNSFHRNLLLLGFYIALFILARIPVEFVWGVTGLVACAALYFLYRGHQRITKMEFITF
ncbi:hypothetical protein IMCC3135_33315 [Granulosicoccus antarcticus IMCC3135]|uniref:Uncharacterized protein n=1 Tax=Granulosicoccus antarcticus IMCC3135 TaxID=1192854 RepID=A0A2Z2P7P7_9GAMM|nr:hypothetical protein IMCC3135_33315 [Granulosicoccus antarcticus IMCC3135]